MTHADAASMFLCLSSPNDQLHRDTAVVTIDVLAYFEYLVLHPIVFDDCEDVVNVCLTVDISEALERYTAVRDDSVDIKVIVVVNIHHQSACKFVLLLIFILCNAAENKNLCLVDWHHETAVPWLDIFAHLVNLRPLGLVASRLCNFVESDPLDRLF